MQLAGSRRAQRRSGRSSPASRRGAGRLRALRADPKRASSHYPPAMCRRWSPAPWRRPMGAGAGHERGQDVGCGRAERHSVGPAGDQEADCRRHGPGAARRAAAGLAIGDARGAASPGRLAPYLTGEARRQALQVGLAAALAIGEERYRAQALAPWRRTGRRAGAAGLAAALAIGEEGIARRPWRPWRRTGRRVAPAGAAGGWRQHGHRRAGVSGAGLGRPGAAADGRAGAGGLAAALAIDWQEYRAQALVALAPQLMGTAREEALAQALSDASRLTGEGQVDAPVALALKHARTLHDRLHQARAFAAVAPQLTGRPESRPSKRASMLP